MSSPLTMYSVSAAHCSTHLLPALCIRTLRLMRFGFMRTEELAPALEGAARVLRNPTSNAAALCLPVCGEDLRIVLAVVTTCALF